MADTNLDPKLMDMLPGIAASLPAVRAGGMDVAANSVATSGHGGWRVQFPLAALGWARAASRRASGRGGTARHDLETSNADLRRLVQQLERAREHAERASLEKSRFLACMAHELRTPVNGILGYAQLLRAEGGLTAAQSARVGAMLDAGAHLLDMIRGVLDLSAIEAGHVAVRTAAVEVRGVAAACLALIRPAAEAKGLRLTLNTAPDVPCRIMADPARLRQILLNLLGNAAKFTSSGSVELRLRLAGGGAMLRAEVADTGQGIPAAQRHRLFQDFERLGSGVSGQAEGAGLGLAISARLAALMGGRLGHLDNLGGGSIFWLDLPLADCPEPADAPAAPPVHPAPAPGVAMRVLVADDDGMSRDIAASFLRAAGHCAATAAGGTEAAEAAAAADFDAVLMDVHMAGMDGIEATRRIRALDGRRGRVPIIAMTASAFAEQVRECLESGMDGHVAKPFTRESLAGALECAAEAGRRRAVRDAEAAPSGPLPPVLDIGVFERTAAVLTPDDVRFHMGTLAARGEALLHGLRGSSLSVATGGDLAEAAHALAGSAGLFGFARLASVARRFEDAAESLAAEVPTAARDLAAALETALDEMHSRGPALMEA